MRYWEIDFVRGTAVLGMIVYHILVDLELFFNWQIGVFDYPLVLLSRIIGVIFTFLLGVSIDLQSQKQNSLRPIIKKALTLFFWAGTITAVTYLLFPTQFIYFGILHLLGTSTILIIPFLRIKSAKLIYFLGLAAITSSSFIHIPARATLDFYPPVPWFGFSLLGLAFAKTYLPWRKSLQLPPKFSLIQKLGKSSLLIYLIHQPAILLLLYIISKIRL